MRTRLCRWLWVAVLAMAGSAQAQWMTQTFELKPGWNAIYTHIDPSHVTLSELIDTDASNPIDEVWMWKQPVSSAQFVESPQAPTSGGSQWLSWVRTLGPSSELQRLIGNNAYLVHVTGAAAFSWSVKGKPVPPAYEWTTTGLNFIGFPSALLNPPTFETFLAKEPELQQNAEIYSYPGGPLGAGNPARVFALRTKRVTRGEAFWIRSGTHFNKFFAPFEITLQNRNGVLFGDKGGQYRLRVKNLTAAPLTVKLQLADSETAPTGETEITGTPVILVRGDLNPTNITYGFTQLFSGVHEWTLAAEGQVGAEREIVLGVNRSAMLGSPAASGNSSGNAAHPSPSRSRPTIPPLLAERLKPADSLAKIPASRLPAIFPRIRPPDCRAWPIGLPPAQSLFRPPPVPQPPASIHAHHWIVA